MKQAKQTNVKSSRGLIQTFKHTTSGTLYPSPTPPGPLPTPVPLPYPGPLSMVPTSPIPSPNLPSPDNLSWLPFLVCSYSKVYLFSLALSSHITSLYCSTGSYFGIPPSLSHVLHHLVKWVEISVRYTLFHAIYSYHFCL